MAKTQAQYARDAMQVQDACNPSGVAHLLSRYYNDTTHNSTQDKCDDPIATMIVMKLLDLHKADEISVCRRAYDNCKALAVSDPKLEAGDYAVEKINGQTFLMDHCDGEYFVSVTNYHDDDYFVIVIDLKTSQLVGQDTWSGADVGRVDARILARKLIERKSNEQS